MTLASNPAGCSRADARGLSGPRLLLTSEHQTLPGAVNTHAVASATPRSSAARTSVPSQERGPSRAGSGAKRKYKDPCSKCLRG